MAKVIRYHRLGGPEVLQFDDVEVGEPGPGQLRLRVMAFGLNRSEIMSRSGTHAERVTLPSRIGQEAAGLVEAVGEGVEDFAVGDRACTLPGSGISLEQHGVYGEQVIFPAEMVVKQPASLSMEQSASIWMQYLTAYGGLIDAAQLQRGEHVVVAAASSSVGIAAIQIVNAIGGVSIATTRTEAKADALLQVGAHHVIVLEEQDYVAEVRRITEGSRLRVVFDPVVGASLASHVEAVSHGGTIVLYGALDTSPAVIPLLPAMWKAITFKCYALGETVRNLRRRSAALAFILDGLERGTLCPIIDRIFPFQDIVAAHRYLEGNQHVGKVVVTIGN